MAIEKKIPSRELIANIPEGDLFIYQSALNEFRQLGRTGLLEIGEGTNGCAHAVYLIGPRTDLSKFWAIHRIKDKAPRPLPAGHITNIHPKQLSRYRSVLEEYSKTPRAAKLKIGPGIDGYDHALCWDGPEKSISLFWRMYSPSWIGQKMEAA